VFKFLKTYKTLFPTSEIIPLPSLIDVFDRVAKCKTIKKCPSGIWKIKLIIENHLPNWFWGHEKCYKGQKGERLWKIFMNFEFNSPFVITVFPHVLSFPQVDNIKV
jgi:hypothetical protein